MIYKYTRCEAVIAKIMADSGMEDVNLRLTDIKEWIFEAVEKIGSPMLYIIRESGSNGCPILKIRDRQVPIPDDLVHLSTVAYSQNQNGPWVPVRVNTESFMEKQDIQKEEYEPKQPMNYKPITSKCLLYGINGMKYLERMVADSEFNDPQYFIKPGWIVINRKKGFIKLSYKAIAVDEKGYPLIPDLASYQEAIYWYVLMKLNFPKFLNGKLGGGKSQGANTNAYYYIQQEWNFYRNQAYAESMMPNESEMINIKNEWNKLVPEWDSDEVFFKSEGEKQLNFHDYYYGY